MTTVRSILCAAVVLLATACGGTSDSTPPGSASSPSSRPTAPAGAITLSATDFKYVPSSIALKVGVPVTLFITNDAKSDDHDLQSDLPIAALSYAHADNPDDEQADNVKNATLDVDFGAGGWAQVTFTPTQAGTFAFHCGEPGHTEAGMTGAFVVSP